LEGSRRRLRALRRFVIEEEIAALFVLLRYFEIHVDAHHPERAIPRPIEPVGRFQRRIRARRRPGQNDGERNQEAEERAKQGERAKRAGAARPHTSAEKVRSHSLARNVTASLGPSSLS